MTWFTAGIQTNPATDAILADTGPGLTSSGDVTIVVGGNIAAVYTVEHRNAANTSNLFSQVIASLLGEAKQYTFPNITMGTGERLRVRLNATVIGSVQASIFAF